MTPTDRFTRAAFLALLMLGLAFGAGLTFRASAQHPVRESDSRGEVSPARRIEHRPGRAEPRRSRTRSRSVRSIDGTGNNPDDPEIGATHTPLLRLISADYADGSSQLAGTDRPSARAISNAVHAQPDILPNALRASDFLWQWGQFVDHDVDLTGGVDPPEPAPIAVPTGDPEFDPDADGDVEIAFNRSIYAANSDPRQQLNEITAWIDASNVYGSDPERASGLRENDGTGRLKTSEGALLPFNTQGFPNAGGSSPELFLAGDVRANEQVGLAALHTLFVREHNRLVAQLAARHPGWDGERLYQKARKRVGAQMQVITYREFLPALLGPRALSRYAGYDVSVDAGIANEFSTAAYRFGHSALSSSLLRLDSELSPIPEGSLALRDSFFAPKRILDEGGIEPLLRGLAHQACQRIDLYVVDDVRNFLFGAPGDGGFDLASLNIQRGRDHGLPGYNATRVALGFAPAARFSDVSSDPEIQDRLAEVYENVDEIDLWVGGLSEDRLPGGHLGPLFAEIVLEQFEALRDGDRFWYQRSLSRRERRDVENTRLSDVIRRNTEIDREIPDDVFHVGG